MFKNMKVATKLGLDFGLVLVLLPVIAFVAITKMADFNVRIVRKIILLTDEANMAKNKKVNTDKEWALRSLHYALLGSSNIKLGKA